jgi:flagellar M-ring protein FliF
MAENKLIRQGKEVFSNLKTWQKAVFIGVPSFFLIGFILLLALGSPEESNYKVLYSDLDKADAAKVTQSLKEKNIDYELDDEGRTIKVPGDIVYDTRISLAGEGLISNSTVGYEIFDQTNLGMSEFVQKVNFTRSLEGELSRTISSLEEVKKSRVHIVIPKTELFARDQKEPSASVTLFLKKNAKLRKANIEGIQILVASSIEGMTADRVSIVDQKGKLISEMALDENSIAGVTAMQLEQQRKFEVGLQNKVQKMLDGVIGVDNSKVTVTADLDFTKINSTKTDYDPEGQIARSEQNINEMSSTADSLSYPNFNEDKNMQNQIANYEISNETSTIQREVGDVARLSVAVMINQKEEIQKGPDGLKRPVYIPRSDTVMINIESIVQKAVGFDSKRGDQISVVQLPFETLMDYDLDELNPAPWYKQPYYQRLIGLLFAMFITLMIMLTLLRSKMVKDRIRLAMELPEKVSLIPDDIDEEDEDDDEEEIEIEDFIQDDLLVLPDDLPETLLLEPDTDDFDDSLDSDNIDIESDADANIDAVQDELSEQDMINLEMKQHVENFCNENLDEAVRIIRIFLNEDLDLDRLSL